QSGLAFGPQKRHDLPQHAPLLVPAKTGFFLVRSAAAQGPIAGHQEIPRMLPIYRMSGARSQPGRISGRPFLPFRWPNDARGTEAGWLTRLPSAEQWLR